MIFERIPESNRPLTVVVDPRDGRREESRLQLQRAQWTARACPGPDSVLCPALVNGPPCALAANADVVVLASDHPRFAELHEAYRRFRPSVGVVVSFDAGHSPTPDQLSVEDAIAQVDEVPSLAYACSAARRRAIERRGSG